MKILKIQAILFISFFIIIGKVIGQTNNWNEIYAETIFSDNFSGSGIDGNKWNISVFKRDIGILIDSTATVKVNNGKLELTMINCPNCEVTDWNGTTYYGNYAGGEIVSNVTPFQYGIFECYAKYAQLGGSWPAFWIIGSDGTPCPPCSYGNEIDISEYFCKGVSNTLQHNIHHYHPSTDCTKSIHHKVDTKINSYSGNNSYHIFKCVWTPNKISYYVDGVLKHEVLNTNQICAETNQKWFPEFAMRLVLSQQITQPYNVLGQEINPIYPQTSFFDWVKVKRFFATPEIICPKTICTSDTAFLDVDSLATNVTWRISQPILFTGPTMGSGKKIPINIASGASGEGTIIFKFKMPSGEYFTATKTFWAGNPIITGISGPTTTPNNQWASFRAQLQSDLSVPTDYNWILNPLNGNSVYDYGAICDIAFYNTGNYQLVVQAKNTCPGWGEYYVGNVEVYDNYFIMISPNPTSGETTVLIVSSAKEMTFDENAEWELEVYDSFQSLKLKNTKLKGKEYKIQTAGWKEGVYMVRVKYNDEILIGKLVVKK